MKPESFLLEPSRWRADVLGYGSAMALVAAIFAGLAIAFGRVQPSQDASAIDNAIMIDLPPADASHETPNDATDGPEQQAARASISPPTPPATTDEPEAADDPKPEAQPTPPPPVVPDPAAVLEPKREQPPPKPVAAPTVAPQDERAPTGSDTPTKPDADLNEEGQPHASAHAITVWQKSLMRRLEIAKRAFGHERASLGTVEIAFVIDGAGALVSEQIEASSGSASLDQAAFTLVRLAAPFPMPPAGARPIDMSFVVPIRFRR